MAYGVMECETQPTRPHHSQTIQNVTEYFQCNPEVQALLLSGSIAHGFQSTSSDVDVMIFVSEEDYQKHIQSGQLTFFNRDLCNYEDGYADGKYLSLNFVKHVLEKGSEPARFAFEGSQILFSKVDGFAEAICKIVEHPVTEKAERIKRFYAQFEAWYWYCGEALGKGDQYLLGTSVSKLILFGGRLILAHNEMLYCVPQMVFESFGTSKGYTVGPDGLHSNTDRIANRGKHRSVL
jgi:hypothetical protein